MKRLKISAAELSYQLSDLPDRETYLAAAATCLHTAIGGDTVGWNCFNLASQTLEVWSDPPGIPIAIERLAAVLDTHPLICHFSVHPGDSPRRISDLLSDQEWKSHRVYNELYRLAGVRYQLAVTVSQPAQARGCAWAINRMTNDFTETDVEIAHSLQAMLAILDRIYAAQSGLDLDQQEKNRQRSGLTPRELEMITLAAEGYSAQQIATLRRISVRTVRKHLEHVYGKLDCHDRVLAINKARQLGLLR